MIYVFARNGKLYAKVFSDADISAYGFKRTTDIELSEEDTVYHRGGISPIAVKYEAVRKLGIWEFCGDAQYIEKWFDVRQELLSHLPFRSLSKDIHLTKSASAMLAKLSEDIVGISRVEQIAIVSEFNAYAGISNKQMLEEFIEIYDTARAEVRRKREEEERATACDIDDIPCCICGRREECNASNKSKNWQYLPTKLVI